MGSDEVHDGDSRSLARLIEFGREQARIWEPDELGSILQHQMSAVVKFDLGNIDASVAAKIAALTASEGLLVKSFRDLFHHPRPPVELLQLTKQFAKTCANHPDSPLPGDVADVLYFASIAAAMTRCRKRITELDDEALRLGLAKAARHPWLDDSTRALLQGALEALNQGQPTTA